MPPFRFLLRSAPTRRTFSSSSSSTVASAPAAAFSAAGFKWVRDRGLDHAVEREKNLIPLVNTKNLINSEPSKSLPVSVIADSRTSLRIPGRPVDFLRRYPSVFREFLPGGIQPHFGLTDEALELDSEEQIMYRSESYRRDVADRVLKLLMLCRANRLPLGVIERLRWDLGLPEDYERSLIPDFPDYFRVTAAKCSEQGPRVLELVCWVDELGSSVMEKKAKSRDSGYAKGAAILFPVQYSRGFEMDKKFKKWVEDWQKLPYFSPYENADYLLTKSDESDRWAVAVLHEFLHILVPKKTEKENALCLGECLGLRPKLKRALFQHPGIFYLSSKNDTYTLVLKEGYKRGVLVENHPLMSMRSKYIHLMNSSKEENKPLSVPAGSGNAEKKKKQASSEAKDKSEEENELELYDSSEDEDERQQGVVKDVENNRRRRTKEMDSALKGCLGNPERGVKGKARNSERGSLAGKHPGKSRERGPRKFSLGTEKQDRRLRGRSGVSKSKGSSAPDKTLT